MKNTGTTKKSATKSATAVKTATPDTKKSAKVKAKADAASGLRELFEDQLKDIYWAEKALVKSLPKMAKNVSTDELREAILEHLEITETQVGRLEEVFELIGKKATAKKCEAMEGLIEEGKEILESTEEGVVRDAGIIAASQKIEHYEIATYGTLAAFARILGEEDAAALLEETLAEEKTADELLSGIASEINVDASEDEEDEEEEQPALSGRGAKNITKKAGRR